MEIKEIWKNIEEYPNYMISNLGRVKSLWFGKEKILKQTKRKDGYFQIGLFKGKKQKTYLVHRLVCSAFLPNPENKPEIDHIDTNPQNNIVSNLRWVTKIENRNNPITLINYSKANKGKKLSQEHIEKLRKANKGRKLTQEHITNHSLSIHIPIVQYDLNGKLIGIWESAKQAGEVLGIDNSSIVKCLKGKYKTCGGFKWMYLQDFLIELKKAS